MIFIVHGYFLIHLLNVSQQRTIWKLDSVCKLSVCFSRMLFVQFCLGIFTLLFFLTNFEVLPIWARRDAFVIVAHFNYTLENEKNLNSSKYVCHHRWKRTSEACSFVWSIYLVFR